VTTAQQFPFFPQCLVPHSMLLTNVPAHDLHLNGYFEALDFLNRMNAENKINSINVGLVTSLYAEEIKILTIQGYFNLKNN
jgi:hypothetical protein